jgi:hypothetical protein
MTQDAGIDLDYDDPKAWDTELARLQGEAAGIEQPPAVEVEISEGNIVTSERTIPFMGDRFRLADKIGLMPLLKFSAAADLSPTDPRGLSAMYAMLRDCIHQGSPGCGTCAACKADTPALCKDYDEGDWKRFEQVAIDTKAEADDLMDVITRAMELIAGRPTEPSSASSDGRRAIRDGSMARSSARGRKGSRR